MRYWTCPGGPPDRTPSGSASEERRGGTRPSHRCGGTVRIVKRLFLGAASLYLLFALVGRFVEGIGAVRCGCRSDCWCKKPVLSTFRWVFPAGHSFDGGGS